MTNEEYLKEVGMAFRLERTRQRLTQKQLAAKCGTTQRLIYSIENAMDAPMLISLKRVADALGKPLKDFV